MKTVIFVRHAKSSWADPDLRDINRPLNKRGYRDAPFMGKLLAAKGIKADLLVSSPANRAYTTAKYFAEALSIDPSKILEERAIYEAYPDEVMEVIQNLPEKISTVLVFGHNPTFTSLANRFSEEYIPNVPTCGVFIVQTSIHKWADFQEGIDSETTFLYPKQYFT